MKLKRVHAGSYTLTHNGKVYRVEKFERIDPFTHKLERSYWSWYLDNGYTSFGDDAYSTKREAIEALQHWIKD